MKPVLLLAFLALVPALADHLTVMPPVYANAIVTPAHAAVRPTDDRVAHAEAEMTAAERARFCGRGS